MQLTSLFSEPWFWFCVGSATTSLCAYFLYRMAQKNLAQLNQSKLDRAQDENLSLQQQRDNLVAEKDKLTSDLRSYYAKFAAAAEKLRQLEMLKVEKQELAASLNAIRERNIRAEEQLEAADQKIRMLEDAEERLRTQFETLANRVFEQKTRTVDEQNKQSLKSLLDPLKFELEGFRNQVSSSFGEQAKERHTLIHEIKNLQQLNEIMAKEAINLTQALKGDNKQQGTWGEVVLGRVLEESGLREGFEYENQVSLENEQGKKYQPDVIVRLPQGKDVVIDAKMVLLAYERYFNAESSTDKEQALRDHITAIRNHIRMLGRKDYHQLHGIQSLDYVLMFIPIEPAFQVAMEAEPSLIRDALENNIMLVSPTTLLVALRTINNLWRYEHQNQNARLIADKAAKLYDKIRLFTNDMEAIGLAIEKAGDSYQGAINKLTTGRGNILRQAESFKALGVEVKRDISPSLLQRDPSCET